MGPRNTEERKTPLLSDIFESTAHFGTTPYPKHTETYRADDHDDQRLGPLRSVGLAESHSANLSSGGQSRLIAHAHDTGS